MNLKFKLTHKLTSVVQIISETQALFSDECSTSPTNAIQIITADSMSDLATKCQSLTIELASHTNFPPIMCTIYNNNYKVTKLTPTTTEGDVPF